MSKKVWTLDMQLAERLIAIETVADAHLGTRVTEHLFVSFADFVTASRLDREYVVAEVVDFFACQPPRIGALDLVDFLLLALRWPELEAAIRSLAENDDIDYHIKSNAAAALTLLWPNMPSPFRSLRAEYEVEITK